LQRTGLAAYLKRGGVIAYPTESCYGLGCDPRNPRALKRLIRLKGRDAAKGLLLIADQFKRLQPFVRPLGAADDLHVFHAGTTRQDDQTVVSGGRVLAVTVLGDSVRMAQKRAYEAIAGIHFDGMQYRRDIGWRALDRKK